VDATPGDYTDGDISPYFWHNGKYPETDEYRALFDGNFADYRLRISGLVGNPVELDLVRPQPEAKWVVFYSLGEAPTAASTTTPIRSSR
jgi:DMSO/TMAO reductase YedYZ molybdopterin-dependent catalytic subunit